MEDGITWVLGNLSQQFSDALGFRLKRHILGERGVKIDFIERLNARRILDEIWIPGNCIDEPGFAPDISCVKNCFVISFDHLTWSETVKVVFGCLPTEHHRPRAMVGVKKSYLNLAARAKLDRCRRFQRQGFLFVSVQSWGNREYTYQDFAEMLEGLLG